MSMMTSWCTPTVELSYRLRDSPVFALAVCRFMKLPHWTQASFEQSSRRYSACQLSSTKTPPLSPRPYGIEDGEGLAWPEQSFWSQLRCLFFGPNESDSTKPPQQTSRSTNASFAFLTLPYAEGMSGYSTALLEAHIRRKFHPTYQSPSVNKATAHVPKGHTHSKEKTL
jgi:hypothetical protein